MERVDLKSLLEALLFTSTEPLSVDHLLSVASDTDKDALKEVLQELSAEYENRQGGFIMREVANGYQLYSNPRWHPQIQQLFSKRIEPSSSQQISLFKRLDKPFDY